MTSICAKDNIKSRWAGVYCVERNQREKLCNIKPAAILDVKIVERVVHVATKASPSVNKEA